MFAFKISTRFLRYSFIVLILCAVLTAGCSANNASNVPSDLRFIMDVGSAEEEADCPINVHIQLDANGRGRYTYYDTGCAIEYDSDGMVTYKATQIVKTGRLKLSDAELEQLWNSINENKILELTSDYRMAIGYSYAFIMVEANGRKHIVDNIGMEVPEVRAIVEATNAVMPEGVTLEYGEGYIP